MKLARVLHISLIDMVYIVLGALVAAFALKAILVPNNFLDGGVTGLSLLIHEIFHVNLGVVILLANIPLIALGAYQVNLNFAFKTITCVIVLALFLEIIPFQVVTTNMLLVSMFGGFFLGIGIGLAMRAGCALDGIEVLALYTLKRSNFTISEIILGLNTILFLIAALHFGLEKAMFAMLTYYVASRTISYVVEGVEEYTGVTIISVGKSQEIKEKLVLTMGRGITIYKGERGFMKESFEKSEDCDIVFTIVTRLEVRKLKNVINKIDNKAFVFTHSIKEAAGGILKRHASSH
jgi:uncharacterized membrane-anchored protein YitT (DUF2179 family)